MNEFYTSTSQKWGVPELVQLLWREHQADACSHSLFPNDRGETARAVSRGVCHFRSGENTHLASFMAAFGELHDLPANGCDTALETKAADYLLDLPVAAACCYQFRLNAHFLRTVDVFTAE
jgi:hypothetical protein